MWGALIGAAASLLGQMWSQDEAKKTRAEEKKAQAMRDIISAAGGQGIASQAASLTDVPSVDLGKAVAPGIAAMLAQEQQANQNKFTADQQSKALDAQANRDFKQYGYEKNLLGDKIDAGAYRRGLGAYGRGSDSSDGAIQVFSPTANMTPGMEEALRRGQIQSGYGLSSQLSY